MSEVNRSDERRAEQRAEAVRRSQQAAMTRTEERAHDAAGGARPFADLLARIPASRSAFAQSLQATGGSTKPLQVGGQASSRRLASSIPPLANAPAPGVSDSWEMVGALAARESATSGRLGSGERAGDEDGAIQELDEAEQATEGGLVIGMEASDVAIPTSLGGLAAREPGPTSSSPWLDAEQLAKLQQTMELVRTGGGAPELVVNLQAQLGRACEVRIQCVGKGAVALRLGGLGGAGGTARAVIRDLVEQLERDGLRVAGAGWLPAT